MAGTRWPRSALVQTLSAALRRTLDRRTVPASASPAWLTTPLQHLLLVDDEAAFREVIAERLADWIRVEQAGTGEEALERLNEFAFDILITDLRLPGVDGRQVLDEAFARYPDIIAIVITGFGGAARPSRSRGSAPRASSPSRSSSRSCSTN